MSQEKIINEFIKQIKDQVKARQISIEEASNNLKIFCINNEESSECLKKAQLILMRESAKIKTATAVINAKQKDYWYISGEGDEIWSKYKNYLIEKKKWESENIEQLDMESTSIINELLNPISEKDERIQGLVLGYVQSGKTSNMAGIIAKAADSGYKFIIIFAGLTDALRRQTQIRIENDVTNHSKERWHWLTDQNDDFIASPQPLPNTANRVTKICVIKKNVNILQRLLEKINQLTNSRVRKMPTLIIDDECDQASLNTRENRDIAGDISWTNKLIKDTLLALKKVSYVGYTATPNAPFLTSPQSADGTDNLFPKDFIVPLKEPKNYFGVNKLFHNEENNECEYELPFIRRIEEEEVSILQPPSQKERFNFRPELTNSLRNACDYYLLALSARACRKNDSEHCCMMIHTSRYTEMHDAFLPLIQGEWLKPIVRDLNENKKSTLKRLESLWEQELLDESIRLELNCPKSAESFDDLKPYLLTQALTIEVLRENSNNENEEDRLDFERDTIHAIVIGGDVLSRGLTIEGLLCSFFLRESSQDDTLMQMGRWFGYRKGYEDLPRIWMTYSVEYDFSKFIEKEDHMRRRIATMREQGLPPVEFPPEVAISKGRKPTAKGKISKRIETSSGMFYDRELWTLRFPLNQDKHKRNKEAVEKLIDDLMEESKYNFEKINDCNVIKNVDCKYIKDFIDNFYFFERETFGGLNKFIESESNNDPNNPLKKWNIGIMEGKGEGLINISSLRDIRTCIRTKVYDANSNNKEIYIKALMGPTDLLIDVDRKKFKEFEEENSEYNKQKRELTRIYRRKIHGNRPLLIIYPISKDSKPNKKNNQNRKALFENIDIEYQKHDIYGIVISFPNTPNKKIYIEKALRVTGF